MRVIVKSFKDFGVSIWSIKSQKTVIKCKNFASAVETCTTMLVDMTRQNGRCYMAQPNHTDLLCLVWDMCRCQHGLCKLARPDCVCWRFFVCEYSSSYDFRSFFALFWSLTLLIIWKHKRHPNNKNGMKQINNHGKHK